jgi:amino acid carrier protein
MQYLEKISDSIWSPWLLGLFLFCGLCFSWKTGFFQLFDGNIWLRSALASMRGKGAAKGGFSQLQALATALASTIGTGSIAGVSTAIVFGGPGAMLWMWVCALLGMMTGFVEKTLTVKYRRTVPSGFAGGAMDYMEQGLGLVLLPTLFAVFCLCNAFVGGNMVQANSIATTFCAAFQTPKWLVGLVVAALCAAVMLGGLGRIGRVSELLVPLMAALYIGGGVAVLWLHRAQLLPTFALIVREAFAPTPAVSGALGYGMTAAMRYGVARGVFTNEAGLGTSAMVHAAAPARHPAQQGFLGMFEVLFATLLVCSVTGLVILTSGVYDMDAVLAARTAGALPAELLGAPLTTAAFATVLGSAAGAFVSVSLLLFAFTSLLGWSYYGERALEYLCKAKKHRQSNRRITGFRLVFLLCVFLGSVGDLTAIWLVSDLLNGLMALPNLVVLLSLSDEAVDCLREWVALHVPLSRRALTQRK